MDGGNVQDADDDEGLRGMLKLTKMILMLMMSIGLYAATMVYILMLLPRGRCRI